MNKPSRPFYEKGKYECEITSQGFTKTGTGKMQFVLKFIVNGRIDPSDPGKLITDKQPYERTYYRVLTDNTIEYFVADMERLGVEIGSFSDLDPANPSFIDLKGRTFDAFCDHDEDKQNGGHREKWGIAPSGGATSKPVESIASSEVKSLDRLFGKHLRKTPSAPTPRLAPQPIAAGGGGMEITDDDIPF